MLAASHPILSCEAAKKLEGALFLGDEEKEWAAMQQAGAAIGRAILRDALETGGLSAGARVLVLVGKGHNGGDALIAAHTLLAALPEARAEIEFVFGERPLRPLAMRAVRALKHAFGERVDRANLSANAAAYDVCLDGIFGFQFRPPAEERVKALIDRVNASPIRFRVAVDLPSAGLFRADFTYATGSVKEPVFEGENAGRIRYLDLGFFRESAAGARRFLRPALLDPLRGFRTFDSDKRAFGHLFVVGGSQSYPGAVFMSVRAALRSGVGLVTAFVPESLVPAYAAQAPEAMWVGCPVAPNGGLALESLHLVRERMDRATAWVIGPGLGREPETHALVAALLKVVEQPVLLDADALQSDLVRGSKTRLVLTPHAGEFARIADKRTVEEFVAETKAVVVLKGAMTRVVAWDDDTREAISYYSGHGGPVLARGGSGDLLAGMIGAQLAQKRNSPEAAAAIGTLWHGLAADCLAQAHGQVAVTTTQLLDFLGPALRDEKRTD
jgi:NAD(P)H-hydrate epimerase